MTSWELLPFLRDLFSKHPEMRYFAPWHLAWVLYALNYADELEDEDEIEAAAETAQKDLGGEAA